MKKFLLIIFAVCATMLNAQELVTFIPGKPGNYELKVDTIKYPYLKDVEVNWYCGFGDLEVNFQSQGKHVVCAQRVPKEAITTLDDGTKLLHMEEIPEVWNPWQDVRTIELFYTHNIGTKSVITDEYGSFYSRDEFDSFICDTVAVLHILKDLNKVTNPTELVSSFQVNGMDDNIIKLTAGDTAKFTVEAVNSFDIETYALTSKEEVLAVSDSGYFELIPEESIEDINLVVTNKTGEFIFTWTKAIEVFPQFDVTNLKYSITSKDKTTIVESDLKEVELEVLNHDSLSLSVETNISETLNPSKVSFTWNWNGKTLPNGVEVKNNKLIISEYVKPEMDGTFNCLVTANDTTITTSFIVTSKYPTANELVLEQQDFVVRVNGIEVLNDSKVAIFNLLGQSIYTGSNKFIHLNKGVYIIDINGKSHKIVIK